jgi:asparagine synthase (glutamine-hydrolysing)
MPGIVALITKMPRHAALPQLMQMVEMLRHEPFYTTGIWTDEHAGVYLGWVVRSGSFADTLPLRNENGDVVMAFSGEEFPDPGVAMSLRHRGHQFALSGPEYLVHQYEEESSFPLALNGRFHGLVVDRKRGRALIFNDRYGMERLYYHQTEDTFYFSAEAKSILAVRPELRRLDARGLGEFISCGAVLENRTLF